MSGLEKELLAEVSRDRLWDFVSTIAAEPRMSGSDEERRAMEFVADTLRSWDVEVETYTHPGLVSEPAGASLEVVAPALGAIDCTGHSFGRSGAGEAELVDLGGGDEAAFAAAEVRGKVALIDGLAVPERVLLARRFGAAGAVFVNDGNLHQMIVSPVWGTPTPDTAGLLPDVLAASVRQQDGRRLRDALRAETVR